MSATAEEIIRRAGLHKLVSTGKTFTPKAKKPKFQMMLEDGRFYVPRSFEIRQELAKAGFSFNEKRRVWETKSREVAVRVAHYAVDDAKRELLREWRALNAGDTIARAALSRLAPGDVEKAKQQLTPAAAQALREAFSLLASMDDDRASEANLKGFSKADTELGHALEIRGIRSYSEAALALKVVWKYRKQIGDLHEAIFGNLTQGNA